MSKDPDDTKTGELFPKETQQEQWPDSIVKYMEWEKIPVDIRPPFWEWWLRSN